MMVSDITERERERGEGGVYSIVIYIVMLLTCLTLDRGYVRVLT